jgi:hypothetical protein
MKTIGFAGTFYTLWDVTVERVDVALGAWYDKVTCTYYQNLSKSLDEAIAKAGTDNVDESLRGKRKSFEYKTPLVVEPKVMTDCEKLFWVLMRNDKAHLVDGVRQEAFNRCIELGYISEVEGNFETLFQINSDKLKTHTIAYKFNHSLRYDDIWYSEDLDKFFIGII